MSSLSFELPNGRTVNLPDGAIASELLQYCDSKLRKKVLACKLDGEWLDLRQPLKTSGEIAWITFADGGKEVYWHSSSHILAEAVKALFPDVKLAIGPSIENGFYYDFETSTPFTPEDLRGIEKKMQEIIKSDVPFQREEITKSEALEFFARSDEHYKLELINDLGDADITLFKQGEFSDLCRGPHVPSTGKVRFVKLLSVAGAYWRGNEANTMLQRIYGISFPQKEQLSAYLRFLEEAKKRDHRKLGKELDLYSISNEVGAGFVIYHPKGAMLKNLLEDFERKEHIKRGYEFVVGPQILKQELWKKSGHYDNYRENMYFTEIDNQVYGIKPMNCLSHMMVYKSKLRSYRDLPIRYFELGRVHRHEKTGVLHGLMRVREFTQDDAHILCRPDQLNQEIVDVIDFVSYVMGVFGFKYEVEVSTRPEKSIGSNDDWEFATNALMDALKSKDISFDINEGDGAFYGPKIDIKLRDVLGRYWQCATVQCDLTLPERFDLNFVGKDGKRVRPVMIHRVIMGSIERFIGILIEHFAGAFPLWISPVQVRVLTISDDFKDYADKIVKKLLDSEIRVEKDFRNEKIGFKIREAQMQKIPYTVIIGRRECEEEKVTIRKYRETQSLPTDVEGFVASLKEEISKRLFSVLPVEGGAFL